MKIKEVMTTNVVNLNPSSTVADAARLMQKHNVGSIPVCDASRVVGILSDRDIVLRTIAIGNDPKSTPVSDIMTTDVRTATPDMEINDAAAIMSRNRIRRIPVVENNSLVGIIALGDLAVNPYMDMEAAEALSEISRPSKPSGIRRN